MIGGFFCYEKGVYHKISHSLKEIRSRKKGTESILGKTT